MTEGTSCNRERDVLDLVAVGQWPARADAELVSHARDCTICRDLALVAVAVADLRDESAGPVRVPDPALVWYRAQVRAREELRRRADRPVLVAQCAAALAAIAVGVGAWQIGSPWVAAWWGSVQLPSATWTPAMPDLASFRQSGFALWTLVGAAAFAAVMAAGFYVAALADHAADSPTDRH